MVSFRCLAYSISTSQRAFTSVFICDKLKINMSQFIDSGDFRFLLVIVFLCMYMFIRACHKFYLVMLMSVLFYRSHPTCRKY